MRPENLSELPLKEVMNAIGAEAVSESGNPEISGVSLSTKTLRQGDLYVGLPGAKTHGAKFASNAVENGAIAILTDASGVELVSDDVPVYVSENPRAALAEIASIIYGTQDKQPVMFGLTGTNGKTTTSYFIRSLLSALGQKTGLIGTIEILADDEPIPSELTTPEAHDVHAILGIMNERDVDSAVMEVSSHALEFNRADGVNYEVVGFTNLTQDHLDLHGTMEEYFNRKAKLFTPEHAKKAVVIVDDEWGKKLAEQTDLPVQTISLNGEDADWAVKKCSREGVGHKFTLENADGVSLKVQVGLPGLFNVANAALATIMVHESDVSEEELQAALDEHKPFYTDVPGRMQVIGHKPAAIVDFAHNSNAMVLAMDAVRPVSEDGKLIIVFGATGERDTTKREDMGRIAVEGADVVIVTDDDPHGEPAAPIREQVEKGAQEAKKNKPDVEVLNIAPREKAIKMAVEMANDEDTILIAGRGHETVQEVMGEDIEMDDRVILADALNQREKANKTA